MTFEETYLNDNILDALYDMHFEEMTPIQEKCIPEILDGHDVMGIAQTGTGKTAAYLLPILSMLDDGGFPEDAINCVIMSPTRELAQQIDQAMEGFAYYLDDVSSIAVYGGNDGARFDQEMKGLRGGAPVVIATPGRLLSHQKVGNLDLSRTSFFVLDEADRMLDMGFSEDILQINSLLPASCQRIMFSATMPSKIRELAMSILRDPVEVMLKVSRPAEKIQQTAYVCYDTQKVPIIQHIFKSGNLKRVIIFCGKKDRVKEITRELKRMKINCEAMHSDLSQPERDEVMYHFKSGHIDVLCATDIVARGIDIDDISIVINFDVPHDSEDYVHRIGRTARADRDGRAITFVSDRDIRRFKQIEEFLGKEIEKLRLPEGIGDGPEYKAPKSREAGRRHDRRHRSGRKRTQHTSKSTAAKTGADSANAQSGAAATKKRSNKRRRHGRKGETNDDSLTKNS
ncbi:MAG: DEAD/DEAH box helicase [Prevotella sp.]|nr:DEAD/DEAH box helicase [Prevotella sp.]